MCISIVFSSWLLAIFCITQWKKRKERYKKYLLYAVYL
jgi:preprotein translocase subunit SecF